MAGAGDDDDAIADDDDTIADAIDADARLIEGKEMGNGDGGRRVGGRRRRFKGKRDERGGRPGRDGDEGGFDDVAGTGREGESADDVKGMGERGLVGRLG